MSFHFAINAFVIDCLSVIFPRKPLQNSRNPTIPIDALGRLSLSQEGPMPRLALDGNSDVTWSDPSLSPEDLSERSQAFERSIQA